MAAVQPKITEHRLTLAELLDWLVEDKHVEAEPAEVLKKERRYYRGTSHPLVIIADQKWKSLQPPHRLLSVESLAEWMAARAGLEYMHIDPLKIDFSAVTDVMSSAYATRFRVLPVGVNSKEAVISGSTITLTGTYQGNGQVLWVCGGTILSKYRPSICQG